MVECHSIPPYIIHANKLHIIYVTYYYLRLLHFLHYTLFVIIKFVFCKTIKLLIWVHSNYTCYVDK